MFDSSIAASRLFVCSICFLEMTSGSSLVELCCLHCVSCCVAFCEGHASFAAQTAVVFDLRECQQGCFLVCAAAEFCTCAVDQQYSDQFAVLPFASYLQDYFVTTVAAGA